MARLRTKKKNNKKRILAILIIAFIVWIFGQLFIPNFSILSIYDRMPALLSGEVGFIIDSEIIVSHPSPIVYEDGEVLLPLSIINTYIDKNILMNDRYIIAIKDDKYIRYEIGSEKYVINNNVKKGKVVPIEKDGIVYLPMTVLEKLYNLEFYYSKETNILMMRSGDKSYDICKCIKESNVREIASLKGMIVGKTSLEEEVIRYKEINGWSKIVTLRGEVGYVVSQNLERLKTIKNVNKQLELDESETIGNENVSLLPENKKPKVNIVWYQVSQKSSNPKVNTLEKIPGMTTMCFTWFEIKDKEGNIRDKSDASIVKWAHKNGYSIWALVANPFSDSTLTHEMLSNAVARENAIKQMIGYCKKYNIDGINVDIESIKKETGVYYVQFIKELSVFAKNEKLVLSLDMYTPSASTEHYNREEIGKHVDYFCIMAYDEHWRTSPVEGSVASLPWVEKGIIETLKYVDKNKVLLGMPSYTRRWKIENDKVTEALALGMERAENDLISNNAKIEYDAKTGQNYGEYEKEDATYKIWLEDEVSVEARLKLASKYNLAGVATWKKGFEKEGVWKLYQEYMNKIVY